MVDLSAYKLTFSDEFDTRSISQTGADTKWADIRSEWRFDKNSDIGFGASSFVDAASGYDPFRVSDGVLTIIASPDKTAYGFPGSWESGLITTQASFSQTYGYFEMRADFSDSKDSWDAFWLLPETQIKNPDNPDAWQELDVVEHYGNNDPGVYSAIHTTDLDKQTYSATQSYAAEKDSTGYHTYGVLWTKDTISFYLDGELTATKPTPTDMNGPMYLLANLAVESGVQADGSPMTTKIDYIRAYALTSDLTPVTHVGTAGADTMIGNASDEIFTPLGGHNAVDGVSGYDILNLPGGRASYSLLTVEEDTFLVGHGDATQVSNVDEIRFTDATSSWSSLQADVASFNALTYIASYADLRTAFGTDASAAAAHYGAYGFLEGRNATAFDGLGYIASYPDLIKAFGANADAGAQHFIIYGSNEARTVTFDGLDYIASYPDLIKAFGDNADLGARHYIQFGAAEGRSSSFDVTAYLLSNTDLQLAHLGVEGALDHWITKGFDEGRAANIGFGNEQQDHTLTAATTISSIDRTGDRDWFDLKVSSGHDEDIKVNTSGFVANIEIHAASGQLLFSGTSFDTFHISAENSEDVLVVISAQTGVASGSYAVAVSDSAHIAAHDNIGIDLATGQLQYDDYFLSTSRGDYGLGSPADLSIIG
jgi:beta-glucanase (GH16 family)